MQEITKMKIYSLPRVVVDTEVKKFSQLEQAFVMRSELTISISQHSKSTLEPCNSNRKQDIEIEDTTLKKEIPNFEFKPFGYKERISEIPNKEMTFKYFYEHCSIYSKRIGWRYSETINDLMPYLQDVKVSDLYDDYKVNLLLSNVNKAYSEINRALTCIKFELKRYNVLPLNIKYEDFKLPHTNTDIFLFKEVDKERIINYCFDHPKLVPVGLMMLTGISELEVTSLKFKDYQNNKLILGEYDPIHRSPREIPLCETAIDLLDGYLKHVTNINEEDSMFKDDKGNKIDRYVFKARLQYLKQILQIKDLSKKNIFIDLLIRLVRNLKDPILINDYLGLVNPSIIIDYYFALTQKQEKENE